MLSKLKSEILQSIFSFLNENKKLNIINNNKNLQKKLNIDIENYITLSKRFKIGERNGKGKEYSKYKFGFNEKNNIDLIFEGYYLNGKKK